MGKKPFKIRFENIKSSYQSGQTLANLTLYPI